MYSDKVEVLRFETEPYRKHLDHNGSPNRNGTLHYYNKYNNNNNNNNNHHPKHSNMIYQNGYHNTLIDSEIKPTTTTSLAVSTVSSSIHHVQPPSDPLIASVLHSRYNPRPGRLLLENVNNRPQTMDRGTQANADVLDPVITEAPSTSIDPTNSELYRNANISVTNQKLLANGGDNSSVDSMNSADSAKRSSEESVIELAEFHQPIITKDDPDGHHNMNNGDGKYPCTVGKPLNGIVKEHPVDDDVDKTSCGMECLYFAMQCCECSIM